MFGTCAVLLLSDDVSCVMLVRYVIHLLLLCGQVAERSIVSQNTFDEAREARGKNSLFQAVMGKQLAVCVGCGSRGFCANGQMWLHVYVDVV